MEAFEQHRPLLFGIAYRMLGSAMDAEDIVQQAYLRYRDALPDDVRSAKAWLSKVVTRLCLDQLKSARERREAYVGTWLPEPVKTEGEAALLYSPGHQAALHDSLSMAFLVLLERLNPVERAVFLLREVFEYGYDEIAEIVGKEEAACRQIFHRAKQHVVANRPRFDTTPQAHHALLDRFVQACDDGDLESLLALLTEDATVWSDGGGKGPAATRPVLGRERVAQFLLGLMRRGRGLFTVERVEANGQEAMLMRVNGEVFALWTFETGDERIHALRIVVNPDKLGQFR